VASKRFVAFRTEAPAEHLAELILQPFPDFLQSFSPGLRDPLHRKG